ncbi:hypothetical protein BCR33DRAFT_534067 [Rhizoclosmatium globosum]|uniref:Uncharacterized protein n=1 Tax=Rhizoclosmatium globosum TaxID=329046 RepID=A0A1Y2BDB8_9FUNG|nr:hypothetical protein BCR33DRAFT_534067 [Rhizoclosmatium globosum]|eukprot:ORY32774.1 hypothetical protein BCR33DRAFT_534067 [Rhizoclosmatium globosum]
MSWDPSLAPTVSHDAIPGFGGPIQTTASPFDGLSRGRSNSRQESNPFGTGIISHTESNVFRQETVPSPSPRSRKSSLKPKSPSRSRLSSPTTLSRAPAPQAGSPIPFSNSGSIPFSTGGTAGEFPFSGGLQTWPTSPTQIHNASLSRRPSSNMMNYSNQQSASKHNSMSFQATTSPIPERAGFSPQLRTPKRSPRGSRPASALVPPIDTSLYQQQQEAEELYYQQQGQQYQQPEDLYAQDPATATDEGTLQIGADTYTTLVTENDALTRQAAATEQHLTNSIQSRLLIEQRCAQLEAERESVMQDMADLKQIVEGFGNLEQRMREIEERERFLVERESAVHAHEAELQSWATGIEARDREVQDRESVLVTTGSEELDSRMRVRIAEIEKSREGVEALWAEVRQKEAEAAERLREAEALKEESAQALNRVEASVSRVREREEDSKRVSEELTKEREDGLAYVQNQQSLLDVKERELRALELEIESRRREFEEGILAFENDKAALENQFRNSELEQARLAEARNALDVLAERLREDQESLRVREAEIRSREDDFLAQASNMANQEAMQLAELRRNYDEDVQRLQFEAADLQQREAQLAVQSDDLYRLSQEVNDEKTRVEQMKREVEHEKAELTNQAKEIQDAQASLASQQSALDDAVASFTEMKAYIDNSMKENESRIRSEFESLQQAHTALKEREEISMCEIQNERMMVEELQKSIENERQESLRYGAESVLNEELVSKIAMLEKDNADLRQYIDDISALRSQDVNQIAELEESNRQLQNNVLRLTQMIESGTIKKSGSMRSLTPSGPTDQNTKLAVDERVELLERKYQEIAKEESSLKEAAAALVSTANDLKKMWNDVVPAVEELKASGGAIDRSHLWSRRADVDVASSVRSTSETDLLGNKDLVNVIVSLTRFVFYVCRFQLTFSLQHQPKFKQKTRRDTDSSSIAPTATEIFKEIYSDSKQAICP